MNWEKTVLPQIVVFLFLLIFFSTPAFFNYIITIYKTKAYPIETIRYLNLVYILLRFFSLLLLLFLFRLWFGKIKWGKFLARGRFAIVGKVTTTIGYYLVMGFIVLECAFTLLPFNSSIVSFSRFNWISYYWTPTNKFGYRDVDFEIEAMKDKKVITCLGGSYTAGWGIENAEDRYSNLLNDKLSDEYKVFNLGKPGGNTIEEFQNLKNFPIKPDVLILQHNQNDLDDILSDKQFHYPSKSDIQLTLQKFTYFSYFISHIHSVISPPVSDSTYERYGEYMTSIYGDETKMKKLYVVFDEIVDYCDGNDIKLVVLLYPVLGMSDKYYDYSYIYTNPIENYFENKNVSVLNLTPVLKKIPANQKVVTDSDSHPNELVNEIIAEELYHLVSEMEE